MRNFARFLHRAVWFSAELLRITGDFLLVALRHGGSPPLAARVLWLHRSSRRTLHIFTVEVRASGQLPEGGLLVSNHLSYLDILVLSSLKSAVFVSKSEVRHWPVFGWFARMGGTIFVRRDRRSDAAAIGEKIRTVLRAGQSVVLFPEGTSSNGRDVLPFKSSLLEPATNADYPLFASGIRYTLADGSVEDDICYWGDMTFFPHFLKLMTKKHVIARVSFAEIQRRTANRKELARQLHAEVVRLKNLAIE